MINSVFSFFLWWKIVQCALLLLLDCSLDTPAETGGQEHCVVIFGSVQSASVEEPKEKRCGKFVPVQQPKSKRENFVSCQVLLLWKMLKVSSG